METAFFLRRASRITVSGKEGQCSRARHRIVNATESDPAAQRRNLLAASVAHFEARKPLDKVEALGRASGATIQINIGPLQRNAGRDYHEG